MNLKQLRARVLRKLEGETTAPSKEEVLEALKEGESVALTEVPYSRDEMSFPFDYSATESWKVPVDPDVCRIVKITFDDVFVPEMDPEDFQDRFAGDVDNVGEDFPDGYMLWNRQYVFVPHPNASQNGKTVKVWVVKNDSSLTDDTDQPTVPFAFQEALVHYAISVLTENPKKDEYHRQRFEVALTRFRGHVRRTMPPVEKTVIG